MLRHILFVKMPAREVDRDRHRLDFQRLQTFEKTADRLDHVPIQHGDGAGLLHRRQKLMRQDHGSVLLDPTDQGFGTLQPTCRGVDLRLIKNFQFPSLHCLHSCQNVADDEPVHFLFSVPPIAFFVQDRSRMSTVFRSTIRYPVRVSTRKNTLNDIIPFFPCFCNSLLRILKTLFVFLKREGAPAGATLSYVKEHASCVSGSDAVAALAPLA